LLEERGGEDIPVVIVVDVLEGDPRLDGVVRAGEVLEKLLALELVRPALAYSWK
jgi:hypothetical protein